jgi:hypothetical protein
MLKQNRIGKQNKVCKEKIDLKKRETIKNGVVKAGLIGAGIIGASSIVKATSIFWRDEGGNLTDLKNSGSSSGEPDYPFPTNTNTSYLWSLPGWLFYSKATQATGSDVIYYCPIYLNRDMTFDRIGVEVVSTSASGTEVVRMGIYEDDDGKPGALILDAGTVSGTSTGIKEITLNPVLSLTKGRYWLAGCAQSTTGWITFRVPSPTLIQKCPIDGKANSITNGTYAMGYASNTNSGAGSNGLPNPAVYNTTTASYYPRYFVMMREVFL